MEDFRGCFLDGKVLKPPFLGFCAFFEKVNKGINITIIGIFGAPY